MIGTAVGSIILFADVIFAGTVGIVAGGVTCFLLKRRWGVWWAAADAGLAVGGAIVAGLILTRIDGAPSSWGSPIWLVFTVGVATVVVVHLLQRRVAQHPVREGGDAYRGAA